MYSFGKINLIIFPLTGSEPERDDGADERLGAADGF